MKIIIRAAVVARGLVPQGGVSRLAWPLEDRRFPAISIRTAGNSNPGASTKALHQSKPAWTKL